MAEEEIIPEVKQQPPQLPKKKEEKKKPEIQPKQPQQKQQQQQQQIKADEKKAKPTLSKDDRDLLEKFEQYGFDWKDKRAGYVDTVVGDDIIFIRRIPNKAKGYAKYINSGQYLIVKTNKDNFEKFIKNEVSKEKEEVDDIKFEYFNFSKDYFYKNEDLFANSLIQKKFLFNNLGEEKKEEEKEVKFLNWNDFKDLDIIPSISDEKKYLNVLENFNVKQNNFGEKEIADEKDLDIADEKPIQQNEPLPKKEEDEEDEDEEIKDDIPEINVQNLQPDNQQQQQQQQLLDQNNHLIAGHTPNGEELRALIKYNKNSDSLLKLIVGVSENNKGEVDFKEIGEIQDLNGDITDLYSNMQELKSKINSSNNAEAKERLLIKYNKKRLKLEDLIKKYSKEAYRLSMLNKKKKATFSNPNYIKNKLNKL